jgi:hypothetical protein
MNMLISEFGKRKEVKGVVLILVFKHKTSQSDSALISTEKGLLTDVVMTIYRGHF